MTDRDALERMAADARRMAAAADAAARQRPGHPSPLAVANHARALALAAAWFTRESPGTMHHALPLVRARHRAITTELETLQ